MAANMTSHMSLENGNIRIWGIEGQITIWRIPCEHAASRSPTVDESPRSSQALVDSFRRPTAG